MVGSITQGVYSTFLCGAWVVTGFRGWVTEFVVGTVVVVFAFGSGYRYAVSIVVKTVSEFDGTDTIATFVNDKTSFKSADASASFIDFHTAFW